MSEWTTRQFHPHQYVKVHLPPNKTEIGIVVTADDDKVVVATRHGYNITAKPKQLQRAFLLVLDLNGVLGARQRKTLFERRPYLEQFLKFALANFVVAVWTSCEERNGKQIVDDLFSDDRDRLLFCLYRGDCTPNPTSERPFGTVKNLQRIFDRWPESFHAVNTVIVDDSADKCSHPDLALCPSQFSGLLEQPEDDGLLSTIAVLEKVLAEDSLHPLIEAAEETRRRAQEALIEQRSAAAPSSVDKVDIDNCVSSNAVPSQAHQSLSLAAASKGIESRPRCCHFFAKDGQRGGCKFGNQCRFSHDEACGANGCNFGKKCREHFVQEHASQSANIPTRAEENVLHFFKQSSREPSSIAPPAPANLGNLASTLLAKLNAVSSEADSARRDLHISAGDLQSFQHTQQIHRALSSHGSSSSALDSPLKHGGPPAHNRHFHQNHHRNGHHQNAHAPSTRNVVTILQNAQRLASH